MEYLLMPLKRWNHFGGRSRRLEYWCLCLDNIIIFFAALLFGGLLMCLTLFLEGLARGGESGPGVAFACVGGLFALAFLACAVFMMVAGWAVLVRRLHDIGLSGFWSLLALVAPISGIFAIVVGCIPGQPGPNPYGPDPRV